MLENPKLTKKIVKRGITELVTPGVTINEHVLENRENNFVTISRLRRKSSTRIALLNADWRDFESTPALKENSDNAITIFDYHRMLSEAGWKVTHRIECPLSSERMSGNQVQKMQKKRILGTVGRTLIIGRRV